jgi:CheY-like chemotaxis protein
VAGIAPDETTEPAAAPHSGSHSNALKGKHVLLVEDSLIIALDGQDVLHDLGAEKVEVASNVRAALRICTTVNLDLAVLDYNLGAENSEAIANLLSERGTPFIFATGYGSGLDSSRFHAVPIVTKPMARGRSLRSSPYGITCDTLPADKVSQVPTIEARTFWGFTSISICA